VLRRVTLSARGSFDMSEAKLLEGGSPAGLAADDVSAPLVFSINHAAK
jgi:hypothetical protein